MLSFITTILFSLLLAQQPTAPAWPGPRPAPATGSPYAPPLGPSKGERTGLPLPPPGGLISEAMRSPGARPVPQECGDIVRQNSEGLYIVQTKLAELETRAREAVEEIESAYMELSARHFLGFVAMFGFLLAINLLAFFKGRKIKADYASLIQVREIAARRIEQLQADIINFDKDYPVISFEYVEHKSLWTRWITWTVPVSSLVFIIFFTIFLL